MSSRAPASTRTSRTAAWLVPAAVVLLAGILIAVVFAMRDGQPAAAPGAEAPRGEATVSDPVTPGAEATADPRAQGTPEAEMTPQEVPLSEIERRDADDVLGLGSVDAPVVMVVFSDYQCGYCARWSAETFPVVMEYVERGDLRLEWRDINIFGVNSERAARATYAAAKQGAFVEYHDALFPDGSTRSEAELTDTALTTLAADLGLDAAQFAVDLTSPETSAEIARNADLGVRLGVYSTPSFLLAGSPIVGAQPTDVFVSALDAAIAAATPES